MSSKYWTVIDTGPVFCKEALSLRVVWTSTLPLFLLGGHKIFISMLYTMLADSYQQEARVFSPEDPDKLATKHAVGPAPSS